MLFTKEQLLFENNALKLQLEEAQSIIEEQQMMIEQFACARLAAERNLQLLGGDASQKLYKVTMKIERHNDKISRDSL